MSIELINVFVRQAAQITHPDLGAYDLPLGRSRIPKLVTECDEFQYLVKHGLVETGSKPGVGESEHVQARVKLAFDRLTDLQKSGTQGPDLVTVRANTTLDGKATGNFDLIRKKTREPVGQSFSNEREAHAAAERMNEAAWGEWISSKRETPARKRAS